MRLLLLLCFGFGSLALAFPAGGQSSNETAYSIATVDFALKTRSGGQKIIFSQTQRALAQLGDGVSIALMKLLDEQQLTNSETVKSFLSIIRDAFDQPQIIALEVDKQPKITMFLLNYLKRNVPDSGAQKEILETIEYVKAKAPEQK